MHAYAYVADKYRLLPHGASMGEQYGPIVVAREAMDPAELPGKVIAVPGLMTSAFLELQLAIGRIAEPLIVPFDEILETVTSGAADAGLVIHEGQLTYPSLGPRAGAGPRRVVARADRWPAVAARGERGAPRPRRGDHARACRSLLHDSIKYGLEHREDALAHAAQATGADSTTT